MTPDPLLHGFETGTLDLRTFHHREHLYVAWCYLKELPLEDALLRYTQGLRRFAAAAGAPEKYHATITWAYLLLLHEAMQDPELACGDFEALLARYPALLDHRDGILFDYYDRSQLDSDDARRHFVLPRPRRVDA